MGYFIKSYPKTCSCYRCLKLQSSSAHSQYSHSYRKFTYKYHEYRNERLTTIRYKHNHKLRRVFKFWTEIEYKHMRVNTNGI